MKKTDSTLKIAEMILQKSKKSMDIFTLFDAICEVKGFTKEERDAKISQFHTHITLDGRFVILHDGTWALREDHPFEAVNTISTDFELFDDEVSEEDEEEYEALEVTVVTNEEELEKEANDIKNLIGYEDTEEL